MKWKTPLVFSHVVKTEKDMLGARVKILAYFTLSLLLFPSIALFNLQILKGGKYRALSSNNRIRRIWIPPRRGIVYDRHGTILVANRPSYNVEITVEDLPKDKHERKKVIDTVAGILGIPPQKVRKKLHPLKIIPYVPTNIATDIGLQKFTAVAERQASLPGVHVAVKPIREYAHGELASHVLGYVGKISKAELDQYEAKQYHRQDIIGKTGIEKVCEDYLRGKDGGMQVQVDHRGYRDTVLRHKDPLPGSSLYLTLDKDLQEISEKAFGDRRGACVILSPENGDIYTLFSKPSYNPNIFVTPTLAKERNNVLRNGHALGKPLYNRVISGQYPAGSLFKIVVALAALEDGFVNPDELSGCSGSYSLGGFSFNCWQAQGHGQLNLLEAIRYSCNVYFYKLATRNTDRFGVDSIAAMAKAFYFGQATGVDLEHEKRGLVPDRAWKKQELNEPWYPGDNVNLSIGQGYLLVTPLQIARFTATIANGGTVYRPRLIKRIVSPDGTSERHFRPVKEADVVLKPENLHIVKEGLFQVVNHDHGTGKKARTKNMPVAGKTGTIQVINAQGKRTHAWFTGYAPVDDPQFVVTLLIEDATSGGRDAAPMAGEIFQAISELGKTRQNAGYKLQKQ